MTDVAGPAVEAAGLMKTFDSKGENVEAVRGVDLRVEAGEVFGFLGPNGAGKSTTVRMLTTLLSITGGSARVAGVDVAARPRRRAPADRRRAAGGGARPAPDRPRAARAPGPPVRARRRRRPPSAPTSCSSSSSSQDAGDRLIKGYSGGMKRRLDLASALVHRPDVLFLDEPTTGLDPASRLTVWDEVRRINEQGTTVFLTTQYLEEADQLCDRLAIIDDGRIVREGTPAQLKADLRERRGLDADPTLDDVFLDATGRTRDRIEGAVQEVGS